MRNLRAGDTVRFVREPAVAYEESFFTAGDIGFVDKMVGYDSETPWRRLYLMLVLRTGMSALVWHDVRNTSQNAAELVSST